MRHTHSRHPLGISVAVNETGNADTPPNPAGKPAVVVRNIDRWLLRRIVAVIRRPPIQFALWDQKDVYSPADQEPVGRIVFHDRAALWSLLLSPETNFGDYFSAGRITIEGDLVRVLFTVFCHTDRTSQDVFKRSVFGRLPKAAFNTRKGSKKNIHHHYDLGNEFYRLWLDENMVYTCAYYPVPNATLEEAQFAKMDHVCKKVHLQPGMQVVEAGCGWGSLAIHMAQQYGVRVCAFNISHEQITFARERAAALGLKRQVEFIEDDYRNISGQFDAFVSVGMLEHVGSDHYQSLGKTIRRVLKPEGTALIHSVGRNRPTAVNAWLEKRIFPGSYPPSLREMMAIFEDSNFSILDIENLRLHYAKTLMEWLNRFNAHVDTVRQMYDEEFVRAWRLYLGGCAASFLSSSVQLFQIVFTHPTHNAIHLTRHRLYRKRDGNDPVWELGSE